MTKLVWGSEQLKNYQSGISNGVLYLDNLFSVWDGLLSVTESNSDTSFEEVFFDARKVYTSLTIGPPQFDVTALSFPSKFLNCLGIQEPRPGFFLTGQKKETFNFSYKTSFGNSGYKIHLVSNAMITSDALTSASLSEAITAEERSFTITTNSSPAYSAMRPSSHMVIDSTKIDQSLLVSIEDILYGTQSTEPAFLTQEGLSNIL